MADLYAVPGETLTGIANAIRSKTGSDEQMTVAAMASAIWGISGGGGFPETEASDVRIIKLDADQNDHISLQLDFVPDFVMIRAIENLTEPNQVACILTPSRPGDDIATGSFVDCSFWRVNASGVYGFTNAKMLSISPTTKIVTLRYSSPYYMVAGVRYVFIALKYKKEE